MAEPHQANATAGDGKVFWPTPAYVGNFDFVVWQRGVDLSRDMEHCPGRAEDGAEKEPLGPAGQVISITQARLHSPRLKSHKQC